MAGFMGRSSGVSTAVVLAALVGAAVSAATLSLTGAITLSESSAPSQAADKCYLWGENNETVKAACGASGPDTTIANVNGDLVAAGDLYAEGNGVYAHASEKSGLERFSSAELQVKVNDAIKMYALSTAVRINDQLEVDDATFFRNGESITGVGTASITDTIHILDSTGGAFAVTLPDSAAGAFKIFLCLECTAGVTINPSGGGDSIVGAGTSFVADTDGGMFIMAKRDADVWHHMGNGYTATP